MSELRPGRAADRQIGSTKVGSQAKPLKYSEKKSCISYRFRADVQTYGHRYRFVADNDAAATNLRS
jgi:hypothetical protein